MPDDLEELKKTHDQMVRLRDGLVAQAEALKAQLQAKQRELEAQGRELEEKRRAKEELAEIEFRATHDSLTGLWNRAGILDILRRELVRAKREGLMVGVLLADLDRFKNVNDTYGHLAGDEVLREASRRMSEAVRSYDAVGRYGDDYFLVVLAGCESKLDAIAQAERIRWMTCTDAVHAKEGEIPISVSIGGTVTTKCLEEESLIRAADSALYRAKRAGGNRVEWKI